MSNQCLFISFEGADGAGKTTAAKWLNDYLIDERYMASIYTREPGGSPDAEDIRSVIVNPFSDIIDECTKLLLILAARKIHLTQTIIPTLKSGCFVISDRYIDSTLIYQGRIGKIDKLINQLSSIQEYSDIFIKPDYTFFLDVSSKIAKHRMKRRHDDTNKLDFYYSDKLDKINNEFREHFKNNDKVIKIDANGTKDEVLQELKLAVDNILKTTIDKKFIDNF